MKNQVIIVPEEGIVCKKKSKSKVPSSPNSLRPNNLELCKVHNSNIEILTMPTLKMVYNLYELKSNKYVSPKGLLQGMFNFRHYIPRPVSSTLTILFKRTLYSRLWIPKVSVFVLKLSSVITIHKSRDKSNVQNYGLIPGK